MIQATADRWLGIRPCALVALAATALVGCGTRQTAMPSVEFPTAEPPSPPATAQPATPTPGPITLWASPGLPPELLQLAAQVTEVQARPLAWVDDPTTADLRLEAEAEHDLTQWVLALAAAFPTLEDELALAELQQLWAGSAQRPIYLTGEVGIALSSVLGPANPELRIRPEDELLELTWQDRAALAIVPFHALDPRWKVLLVDGQSPIRKDFIPELYPLTVEFGLSGDPELYAPVAAALNWPSSNRDPSRLTTLLMTGVTALVRGTAYRMDRYTPDYPAFGVGEWLREADLAHISNEVSFYENCPPPDPFASSLRFCSAVPHLRLLETIEVDLVELTGNHLLDYGAQPFLETLARYRDLGIQTFGGGSDLAAASEPALVEHNGNRLAFLGCNRAGPPGDWASEFGPGAMPCADELLLPRVSQLAQEGYLVIFTFQWPESANPVPLPDQRAAFQAVVDAGAAIVSGSQAHRPQAMEFYGEGFIHYGLGNLFFDQMHSLAYRQEFLDRHVFFDGRHISTELLTAVLEDYAQPQPMTEAERREFLQEMFAFSGW